jgi:glycosyltransferase involved in cell wall biosynthesis
VRALLVTYVFPPVGGAGVARTLKLAKYLPDHGVTPAVLTAANPSVPLHDPSLLGDVRPDLEILRARTFEPSYALKQATWSEAGARSGPGAGGGHDGVGGQGGETSLARRALGRLGSLARAALVPDPQILWQPHAQMVLARRLLGGARDDVVFISGPPFSQFLLAPLARARPGTGVVLDYRDEWATYRTAYEMMGRPAAAVGPALERTLLRAAHAVTTATEAFRRRLLDDFPFLDPARVHAIPNGFDPDDFPGERAAPPADRFVLTYAGTIFRLTSARGLLRAIRLLHDTEPELARLLEVRFIGRIVDTEAAAFAGTEVLGVRQLGYLEKADTARNLSASHMVLCLLADVPGAERIYPGKVFELMYLGRPCLTIAPPGALTDLVRAHELGPIASPTDPPAITRVLATALRAFRAGTYSPAATATGIDRYHRRAQAGQFAAVFRQARGQARGPNRLFSKGE